MQLIRIGNGSALNPKKTNSSFMVIGDKCNMLIDCGYNVYPVLKAEHKVNNRLKYIFITHMDDDHIGSLRALMYDLYFIHKTVPAIICCDEVYDKLRVYLEDHNSLMNNGTKEPAELCTFISLLYDIEYGLDLNHNLEKDDKFTIRIFKNKHFQAGSGISIYSHKTKNGISITGDTVPCEEIAEEFAYMTAKCNKYTMFHDYSNWDAPAMQVHACKTSIEKAYTSKMIKKLKYYHNDAVVNRKTIFF